jgi:host factor-I protein
VQVIYGNNTLSVSTVQTTPDNPPAQDRFLSELQERKDKVSVFLVNGIRLSGTIAGFDNFIVVLSAGGMHQMVNKHAIAAIARGGGESSSERSDDERIRLKQARDESLKLRVRRTGREKTSTPRGRVR